LAQAALPAPAHALETNTGLDNRKLLMWLFLGSECLFFGSFIAAYMLYRNRNVQGPYPDELFDIPFTSVSSFVLLMSSLSMVLALAAIQQGDVRRMRVWLLATSLLGMLFLGGQAFEFTEFYREGLRLDTNMFGTTFFVLTGFHGAHVTVGVLILMSMWGASFKGKVTQENAINVELAGLYWHFVDIVWIIIFTMIYLVQV
jgi:cytochrome c oxidase subunit 3/cytochrome o ubiquinol oxidase subunit 3